MPESREQRDRWIRSVLERFEADLLRYAIHITGDYERGRDVVQDTFLRLCRQDPAAVDGHLAEWLFTVCRNRALDVVRKEKRMTSISSEQSAVQTSREPSQAAAAEQRDLSEKVRLMLNALPERQQEVVRLKFQQNLSYRQISSITGLSISNVGYHIHKAIQAIRREMGSMTPAYETGTADDSD